MRADLAAFFQHIDVFRGKIRLRAAGIVLLDEIRQVQCAGEAGRARAYDEYIGFELFALNGHESLNNRDWLWNRESSTSAWKTSGRNTELRRILKNNGGPMSLPPRIGMETVRPSG